jgi:serine/threonine protein phosphatase PrpC
MISCGRVMNRLAITRAFGDFEFKTVVVEGQVQKREYICSEPEVRMMELDPFTDDFIIVGSDGLFDKFTSQEVVTFINAKLQQDPPLDRDLYKAARDIVYECIYNKHVKDNITVILVALNRGD